MLPRVSAQIHPFTQQRRKVETSAGHFSRKQKILNSSNKRNDSERGKRTYLYFLRISISGIMLAGVIAVGMMIRWFFHGNFADDTSQTFLVIAEEADEFPVSIVSTRGHDNEVAIVQLSGTMMIPRKQEPALSLSEWFQQLSEHSSQTELKAAMSRTLGFPIDTVVQVTRSNLLQNKAGLLSLSNPFSNQTQFDQFTGIDRAQLWWYLLKTDSSRFQYLKPIKQMERESLSSMVQKYFADTSLLKDHPTVAVVNTTDTNGLAKQIGEILSSWGYSVINLSSDSQEVRQQTQIIIRDDLRGKPAAQRLEKSFPKADFPDGNQELLQTYRSEIIIFVGGDIAE